MTNRRSFLFACAAAPLAALTAVRSASVPIAWYGADLAVAGDCGSQVFVVMYGKEAILSQPKYQEWIERRMIVECHQHKDSALVDAMTQSIGARRRPLTVKIGSKA